MAFLLSIPAIVSLLALAAHFLRENNPLLMFLTLGLLCFLFVRRRWVARMAQIGLVFGCFVWVWTTWLIVQDRIAEEREWRRAAIILLSVAAVNLLAAALYQTKRLKAFYTPESQEAGFPVITPNSPNS